METTNYMSAAQRRAKARCIRALIQIENPKTSMTDAAAKHKVSRAYAYRLLEELRVWEAKAAFEQEAKEILAQLAHITHGAYDPYMWLLASGKMTRAYAQGDISTEMFNGQADPRDDLLK